MLKTSSKLYTEYALLLRLGSDILLITKSRLTLSVVFSSVAGYFLGTESWLVSELVLLIIGGYCMSGASNAFNQVIERDLDAKMLRTQNRPIPAGRMSASLGFYIATFLAIIGLVMLYVLNPKTALFGAISMFLYTSVYTPLKTKTSLSVFVGAIPGAIPFMLGWVAATGSFGIESGVLFMIQFFWQFPHFWAIGWMMHDDYKRVGINMLPTGKKDQSTALQVILYTLWMLVISVFPVTGLTGTLQLSVFAAIIIALLGLTMLRFSFKLYSTLNDQSAKKLMLVSVLYISLIQIIYVIDNMI